MAVIAQNAKASQGNRRKNKISPKEVPLKFLIPFMEKSSLEGEDDNLIEKWAQLLTSATIDERDAKPIYVDILSGLTGDDIKALDEFLPPKFYENMKEMKEKIKTLVRGEISSSELITTLNASNRDTPPGTQSPLPRKFAQAERLMSKDTSWHTKNFMN